MQKITPFLWFDTQAEEAAEFYTSIFPNSKIFDTFGQYTWMYVYSGAIGLGAVAIALAFPPFPKAVGASTAAA